VTNHGLAEQILQDNVVWINSSFDLQFAIFLVELVPVSYAHLECHHYTSNVNMLFFLFFSSKTH
jgi:hypothetical protein